ncbi:hypothetical protein [Paratractidigestivibacter sp.]|uniref:hypothetical protein n=1 Tax=Paratractidigestivibacter sp. TaxID=2847316 RepID=UPI002ACB07B1|nr:hypothetical protein [Paratractidigestivibacter sp.]
MTAKDDLKNVLKRLKPLYKACRYVRHPSVLKRRLDSWAYRWMLLLKGPSSLSDAGEPSGVTVSLTSYGKRLNIVHLTILSLMRQSVRPDRIVLWLDVEEGSGAVPGSLRKLEGYGLDIRYGCEDLKGHKKYFWALREFADSCVITIDDDVMYPADTVESLVAAHKHFPDAVVARRVNRMVSADGELVPYAEWEFEWHECDVPRDDLLATGVGGVLYPPRCFGDQAFDLDPIESTGLGNDDLWLKANEIIEGRKVAWAPCERMHPHEIAAEQDDGLSVLNVQGGGNDASIKAIERALGVSFASCVE